MRPLFLRTLIAGIVMASLGLAMQQLTPGRAAVATIISQSACSPEGLRSALQFAPATEPLILRFEVDCSGDHEIELTSETGSIDLDLQPGMDITIDANGHEVVFDGNDQVRAINADGSGGNLTLKGLVFKNGNAIDGYGEGVFALGSTSGLTVKDCTFTSNQARHGGGAIAASGQLRVTNSVFTHNQAPMTEGGAVFGRGPTSIADSVFTMNSAFTGAAVALIGPGDSLALRGSTISENEAVRSIIFVKYSARFSLTNSTVVHNNTTIGSGSSVIAFDDPSISDAIITNSTIANNISDVGIESWRTGLAIRNSIVYGNGSLEVSSAQPFTVDHVVIGPNVVGEMSGSSITNADPGLGPLQDNGGPTMTMAITTSSVAFDFGNETICGAPPGEPDFGAGGFDKRGFSRAATCSAGAFEPNPADLSVTKSGPASVTAGTTAAYVVSITNTGPDTAHNVSLVESIPAGATTLSMLQQTGTKSFTISQVTGGYTATAPMLPVGQSATFEVRISIPPDVAGGTILVNTATASSGMPDSNLANNTRSVSSTVQTVSDLVITKTTESPSPVLAGTELTYRLQIENRGPSDAAMVKVNDVLPAAVTFVSAAVTDGDEWLKSEPPEGGTGTVNFSKNSVAAGETASFEIVVKVNPNVAPNTRLINTATVSSASQAPTPANGSDTAAITVSTSSDVSITKESSPKPPATVAPGGTIEYTLKVRNDGPSNARQVRVTDVVPAGTRFVSATVEPNTGWVITSKPSPGSTGSVVFSNSQLASGAETILTVVVKVNPTVAHGTVIRNTATIGSSISPGSTAQPTPDSDPGNNSATVETTVGPPPASLAIARGATPASMTAGISSRS